ncbi:MAG: hypothetical protein VX730_01715 [Pseudomonadota bacterium]|nr:hypothetical protein [Pseudomonadota bacterium]
MKPFVKVAALAFLSSGSATAATDGTLGTTSTFSYNVTITIPERVRISGLQDMAFGTMGSSDLTLNDDVCIYSNTSGGNYDITATGSGAGNAFTIASGPNTVPYRVFWNDVIGTAGQVELSAGTTLVAQTGADRSSTTCGGANNANIEILIERASTIGQPNGSYAGVVTLVVEPN